MRKENQRDCAAPQALERPDIGADGLIWHFASPFLLFAGAASRFSIPESARNDKAKNCRSRTRDRFAMTQRLNMVVFFFVNKIIFPEGEPQKK